MTVWAAIPAKPVGEGKSRLAAALSPPARARLNGILFRRTLEAVLAVLPPAQVIVVSRDAGLRAAAHAQGTRVVAERGGTLNAALDEAAMLAGQDALLAISTDLPELTPADVRAMLGQGVRIAPDRARRGTNALFMPRAGAIPFRFGKDSFQAHLAAAGRAGIPATAVDRPGLAFDLDLPADLASCPPDWLI